MVVGNHNVAPWPFASLPNPTDSQPPMLLTQETKSEGDKDDKDLQ